MAKFIICVSIVFALVSASMSAENDPYRDYLISIDGFERWFRIGSYEIEDGEKLRVFDLYYYDSDERPDGKAVDWWIYPNSFGLYCVWKNEEGIWTHKEIGGRCRVGFSRVVSEEKNRIIIELRGKFHRIIRADETPEEAERKDRLHKRANRPFQLELMFVNGVPLTKEIAEPGAVE